MPCVRSRIGIKLGSRKLLASTIVFLYVFLLSGNKTLKARIVDELRTWDVIACTSARMDADLLRSWVLWNHVAGIEHFVIMDNNDVSPAGLKDDIDEQLGPLIRAGLVTVHRYYKDVMNNLTLAGEYGLIASDYESLYASYGDNQLKRRCYDLYHPRAKWVAFIDVDEVFVSIDDSARNIAQFLNRPIFSSKHIGGVGFFWRFTSYTGHFLRPGSEDSFSPFKLCERTYWPNRHIKTVVRGTLGGHQRPLLDIGNAHYMDYVPGYSCVLENAPEDPLGCVEEATRLNVSWLPSPSQAFQINHYYSRSFEDYATKASRGVFFNQSRDITLMPGTFTVASCSMVFDLPTARAASRVDALRKRIGLHSPPKNSKRAQLSSKWADDSGTIQGLLAQALSERRDWDQAYYLEANENNEECTPTPPEDTFIHFINTGYAAGCNFQFSTNGERG